MRVPFTSMRTAGSALIESLLALVVFSVGLLSLLVLLTSALKQSDHARYRSEASLLASDLIGQMWSGDRTLQSLRQRFDSASETYQHWLARVQSTLPGVTTERNQPELLIDDARHITLRLHWQAPSDTEQHHLVVVTQLTD